MKKNVLCFFASMHASFSKRLIPLIACLVISLQVMSQNCQSIRFYLGPPEALSPLNNSYRISVRADIVDPASPSFLMRGILLTVTVNADIGAPTILAAQPVPPVNSPIQGSGGTRTLNLLTSPALTIADNSTLFFIDVTGVPGATLTATLSQGILPQPGIAYFGSVPSPRCETGILGGTPTRPSVVTCYIEGATMYGSTKMADPSGFCFDYGQQSNYVSDVRMTVTNMLTSPPSTAATFTTDFTGPWEFMGTAGGSYLVTAQPVAGPYPQYFHECGLEDDPDPNSYGDLQLISRHVLGIESFYSAWQHFAADVNNSNSITTYDIALIRKVILNLPVPGGFYAPWKVYPEHAIEQAQALIDNNQSPFVPFLNFIQLNPLVDGDQSTFFAIKMGDVNGTCNNCSHLGIMAVPEERSFPVISQSTMLLPELSGKSGETIDFPVFSGTENSCMLLNLDLVFDQEYFEVIECTPSDRFGLAVVEGSSARYSYLDVDDLAKPGTIKEGQRLFSVKLRLRKDIESIGDHVQINPGGMASVWLDGPYGKSAPQLKVSGALNADAPVQIWPNPATSQLSIVTTQPSGTVFSLYSSDGRLVLSQNLDNGTNIDISSLVPGFYTYVINGGEKSQTGKLIKE